MISPIPTLIKKILAILSWVPLFAFFFIIVVMFLNDFQNEVDAYFVSLVLKSCLILLFSTLITHVAALIILSIFRRCRVENYLQPFKEGFEFLSAFPLLETGIFCIAIFFRTPVFQEWVYFIALLSLTSTIHYWHRIFNGPLLDIYNFARIHKMAWRKSLSVPLGFATSAFIDYFFIVLKRALMPLVFILVVMDFKIIVPRLVQAGMSYQAFGMFLSLIVSLHLLSYKGEST